MDVQEIVWEHLKRVGATGLCNESCGCEAPDLMPCDDCTRSCVPAVRKKCGPDCEECLGQGGCMTPLEPMDGDPDNAPRALVMSANSVIGQSGQSGEAGIKPTSVGG